VNLPGTLGPGFAVDPRPFPRVRDQNPKVAKVVNYA
jgi:hypothetical protein